MKEFVRDEGYDFGLGVFETISLKDGKPQLWKMHEQRLKKGMGFLGILKEDDENLPSFKQVMEYLEEQLSKNPKLDVLKVSASKENISFSLRKNTYTDKDYARGFALVTSKICRNETSPLVYHKTFNYGDNILEKRKAKHAGFDEPVFFNTKGELTEGATSNLFLCKDGKIYTPKVSCGILNGIMRQYIMRQMPVEEIIITREEIEQYDEMFLTNSLLGVMSVKSWDGKIFAKREIADRIDEIIIRNI